MTYVWRSLGLLVVFAIVGALNLFVFYAAAFTALDESGAGGPAQSHSGAAKAGIAGIAAAPSLALLVGCLLALVLKRRRNDVLAGTFAAVCIGFFVTWIAGSAWSSA